MVVGIIVSELLFRNAIASLRVRCSRLRAVECRQVDIVVRRSADLVVGQSGEFPKPRGSLPDNEIEDKCAYGGNAGRVVSRAVEGK